MQATWRHTRPRPRSADRWFTSPNQSASGRKPTPAATMMGSVHVGLRRAVSRSAPNRSPDRRPGGRARTRRARRGQMTTMTAAHASTARRPLPHREDTYRLPAVISTMVPANHSVEAHAVARRAEGAEKRRQGGPEQDGHAERDSGFHGPLLPRRHRQEQLGLESAEVPLLRARERSAQQRGGAAMKDREYCERDTIRFRERLPDQPERAPLQQRRSR